MSRWDFFNIKKWIKQRIFLTEENTKCVKSRTQKQNPKPERIQGSMVSEKDEDDFAGVMDASTVKKFLEYAEKL